MHCNTEFEVYVHNLIIIPYKPELCIEVVTFIVALVDIHMHSMYTYGK